MNTKSSKRYFTKRSKKIVLAIFIIYTLIAVLPYINQPEGQSMILQPDELEQYADRTALLETGTQALTERLILIENAQKSIKISTYLFACDSSGDIIAASLLKAADRGVKIQILVDGLIGGINFNIHALPYLLGSYKNIEIKAYNPVKPLLPWTINSCLHEKYIIADNKISISGGRNISDEFLTPEEHPDYKYDLDLLIYRNDIDRNEAVQQLTDYYDNLYNSNFCSTLYETVPFFLNNTVENEKQRLNNIYYSSLRSYPKITQTPDYISSTVETKCIQLLSNPINDCVKQPTVWVSMAKLMKQANQRVWIQSPYIVLNSQMKSDLKNISKNIDYKIITGGRANSNSLIPLADYLYQRNSVANIGADILEFQGSRPLHAKAILIDDNISIVGSFNFDMRSAYIDTEIMFVVYGEQFNSLLAHDMIAKQANCYSDEADGYTTNYGHNNYEKVPIIKTALIYIISPLVFIFRYLV